MLKIIKIYKDLGYEKQVILSAIGSAISNLIVGIFKLVMGIFYISDFLIVNSIYFLVFGIARGFIIIKGIFPSNGTEKEEKTIKRKCGIFEIIIGISYFFVSLHTYFAREMVLYPQYLIYIVVVISFEKIISALYGIHKTKKKDTSSIRFLKIIESTEAVVSIVVVRGLLQNMKNISFSIESTGIFGMFCSAIFMIMGIVMMKKERRVKK